MVIRPRSGGPVRPPDPLHADPRPALFRYLPDGIGGNTLGRVLLFRLPDGIGGNTVGRVLLFHLPDGTGGNTVASAVVRIASGTGESGRRVRIRVPGRGRPVGRSPTCSGPATGLTPYGVPPGSTPGRWRSGQAGLSR
ncbi:hypothetical protein GCM10027290_21920 [Micromonospora sonneratiae]